MPKGIGYKKSKKKGRKPRHSRLVTTKMGKQTYGSHKGSQGRGRTPPKGYKPKRVTGKARPVSGLRKYKKKRRTLKKL